MGIFKGFKVVETDNFGGDYPNEKFIGVTPEGYVFRYRYEAQTIADAIIKVLGGPAAQRYWKVVEGDYTLVPGFEP